MKLNKNKILIYLIPLVIFAFSFIINSKISSACGVQSATFSPSGPQAEGWYTGADQKDVKIDIITTDCENRTIEVSLTENEKDGGIGGDDDLDDSGLDNREIVVPTSNHITMYLKAGEEECEGDNIFDSGKCSYYITIYKLDTDDYISEEKISGELMYECEGFVCLDNWKVEKIDRPDGISETPKNLITDNTLYAPLARLPGLEDPIETDPAKNPCPFGNYLNLMIKLIIGIAAVLAMVMITIGGIQYMTSELVSSKESGKNTIQHAILGLFIALGAWLILNTINPKLLDSCLKIPLRTIVIEGESSENFKPIDKNILQGLDITCNESGGKTQIVSIAKSFENHSTYSQNKRNTYDATTAYFDCSSYVAQVYKCAGLNILGNNTNDMFGSDTIALSGTKVDGVELAVGDLLGWKKGESKKYPTAGHVVMYIGNGEFIEVHGPSEQLNQAIGISSLDKYLGEFKHIKRVP